MLKLFRAQKGSKFDCLPLFFAGIAEIFTADRKGCGCQRIFLRINFMFYLNRVNLAGAIAELFCARKLILDKAIVTQ